jgi:hypothetical protein
MGSDRSFSSSQLLGDSVMKVEPVDTLNCHGQDIISPQEAGEAAEPRNLEKHVSPLEEESPNVTAETEASIPSTIPTFMTQSSAEISNIHSSSFIVLETVSKSFSSTPGYISNRWNAVNGGFSPPSSSDPHPFATPSM